MTSSGIVVLGGGSWGTALATVLANNTASQIHLWMRDIQAVASINTRHINTRHFTNNVLPSNIVAHRDLNIVEECSLIVLAIPAQAVRQLLKEIKPLVAPNAVVVIGCKGIENSSLSLISDVVRQELPQAQAVVISGPNFATEIMQGLPSATVIAGDSLDTTNSVIARFYNRLFRCYYSDDLAGVQVVGAVKNVLAIAAGISQGLGFAENTKALIISRGIAEIVRIVEALGGKRETVLGLAGIGDLVLTCGSRASRNMQFGYRLGQGSSLAAAMKGETIEGYFTTAAIYKICEQRRIYAPIMAAIYQILYNQVSVREVVERLLNNPPAAHEFM